MRYLTILAVTLLTSCSWSWPWQWGDSDTGNCLDDNSCDEANPFEEKLIGGTWYCYGKSRSEPWDCSQDEDPSKVAAIEEQMEDSLAMVQPRAEAAPPAALTQSEAQSEALAENSILADLPDSSYAVQLIAVQTLQEVDNFSQRYNIESPMFVRINTQGDYWYVVLLDVFSNKEEADLAAETWNEQNQPFSRPWVRPVGPLKTAALLAQPGA